MRTHTTSTLKSLILNDMNPAKHTMTKQEIDTWIQMIPGIFGDMVRTMNMFTSILTTKDMACKQINQIQRECTLLLDGILKVPTLNKDMMMLQTAMTGCLNNILKLIETDYERYMDYTVHMPLMQVRSDAADIQANMEKILSGFVHHKVDPALQSAACHCMKEVIRLKKITYNRMRFVQRLQKLLLDLVNTEKGDLTWSICEVLYYEDYNFKGFTDFYKSWIKLQYADEPLQDKYHGMMRFKQLFEKAPSRKKALKYDDKGKATHAIMYDFILGELRGR